MRRIVIVAVSIFALAPGSLEASALEDTLEHQLRGTWAIATVEMRSDCGGFYNNNELHAGGVSAKGSHLFEPGELVHIEKINLKSTRLDLFLKLSEPILVSHFDGPFELFEERSCKVQLIIPLPRSLTHGHSPTPILDQVHRGLEVHPRRQEAALSPEWNHRRRAEYPADYENTLYEHARWKAQQTNAAISDRMARATHEATRIMDRISSSRGYLAGFAAGVESMRRWDEDSCSRLIDIRFSSVSKKPDQSGRDYRDGFLDGQELSFNLLLLDRLQGCFVPPPSPPGYSPNS